MLTGGDGTDSAKRLMRSIKQAPIDVIDYEIKMLVRCFRELHNNPSDPTDDFPKNVLIETYLLHYRALLEFFCFDRRRYPTTLLLAYSGEWATRTLSADEIKRIRDIAKPLADMWFQLIGEQLAHCTHPRYQQKVDWPYVEMQKGLELVLVEFDRINQALSYR
jgi:hypothetical protein